MFGNGQNNGCGSGNGSDSPKKLRGVWYVAAFLTMVFAAGCGGVETTKEARGDAPDEAGPKMPSEDAIVFMYGIRYADTCIWATLDDAAAQEADFKKAKVLAEALGMPAPSAPSKAEGIKLMDGNAVGNEIKARKGEQTAAIFFLATHIKVGLFGSALNSDTSRVVAKIEAYAKDSGIPESVWKADILALKSSPTGENFEKLTQDVIGYFKE